MQSSPEYSEIRETFKRVKRLKSGDVDTKTPVSFNLSKKLNDNRRRNIHDYEEHIKNLASLQRRMGSIGSVNELTVFIISFFCSLTTGRKIRLTQYRTRACFLGRLGNLMGQPRLAPL